MLEMFDRSGCSLFIYDLFMTSSTISSIGTYLSTSGTTPSSPALFPYFIDIFAHLYSSSVNMSSFICKFSYIYIYIYIYISTTIHKYPNIYYHLYADDIQLYMFLPTNSSICLNKQLSNCANDIKEWIISNNLLRC